MAPATARFDLLRRRLSCFAGDPRDGRKSVGDLIGHLGRFGEVAIVGGLLRDLLLNDRYAGFSSDVDLVVDAPDTPALRRLLASHGAVENRFGGWGLDTAWKSDVWLLGRTWAHVHGHKQVGCVDDLLDTTFFNWDAVLYSWARKRVICRDGYLDDLDARRLDIVLEENPNRVGSCVRTLRSAVLWGAAVSPRLAGFAVSVIEEVGAASLVAAEARSYAHRRLLTTAVVLEACEVFRAAAAANAPAGPLGAAMPGVRGQLALPLPNASVQGAPAVARLRRRRDVVASRGSALRHLPGLDAPSGDSGLQAPGISG